MEPIQMLMENANTDHSEHRAYRQDHCVCVYLPATNETQVFRAKQNVPSGIPLSDDRYWIRVLFDAQKKIENYLVGCAAVIFNEKEEVLIGRRLDFAGNEVWALFGGKPEGYESLAEGLAREIWEELHIAIHPSAYHRVSIKEAFASPTQRCVTAYFAIKLNSKEVFNVVNREPHKCFELDWASMRDSRVCNLWQESYDECLIARDLQVNWALR